MDFTREPIIETVITPKEGYKLVVRSSKNNGQEEHFVDAVEVISFGGAIFLRSTEKPRAFLVPASDYEVLEVREARMVLKNVGVERSIKIGGGKAPKEPPPERADIPSLPTGAPEGTPEAREGRQDKQRRDRRRSRRRRGGREEGFPEEEGREEGERIAAPSEGVAAGVPVAPPVLSALLPPPSMLISETIARYRENAQFKGAFYEKEAGEEPVFTEGSSGSAHHPDDLLEALAMQDMSLEPSDFGSFGSESEGSNWQIPREDLEEEEEKSTQPPSDESRL